MKIQPRTFAEALKILENFEKKKPSKQELGKMIATLAKTRGWATYETPYLEEGIVMIGTAKKNKIELRTPLTK